MAGFKWNDDQLNAINSVDKNVLVSASAGSGKTTVMLERTLRQMINKEHKVPLKKMVLVTFTSAVAAELKSKLATKIMQKIASGDAAEDNDSLRDQLEDIPFCDISTLDAFCLKLIKEYFEVAEIDPSVSVIDSVSGDIMLKQSIDYVLDNYRNDGDETFKELDDYLGYAFKDALTKSYSFISTMLDPIDYVENVLTKNYDVELIDNVLLKNRISYYKRRLGNARDAVDYIMSSDDYISNDKLKEYVDYYDCILNQSSSIINVKDAIDFLNRFSVSKVKKPSSKQFMADTQEKLDYIHSLRKKILDDGLASDYKNCNYETECENIKNDKKYLVLFAEVLNKCIEKYQLSKKQENYIDFVDIERLTIKILKDEKTLHSIKDKYEMISIDEYQDTNPVQEYIMSTISNGKNMFMVGDLKQSIYGFRQTDPRIFLKKYNDYKFNTESGESIKLNTNFRSNPKILDFVNEVFSKIMSEDFGGINYKKESKLSPPNNVDDQNGANNKGLVPFDNIKRTVIKVIEGVADDDVLEVTGNCYSVRDHHSKTSDSGIETEGSYISSKIQEIVSSNKYFKKDGSKIEYKDIAILAQSRNKRVARILNSILDAGIPVDIDNVIKDSENSVIKLLLDYVTIIDNFKQDISLVSVMSSIIGGFSLSELALIREQYPKIDKEDVKENIYFYECVEKYSEEMDDELSSKLKKFINNVEMYRNYSTFSKVSELLIKIEKENNIDAYALSLEGGEALLNQLKQFILNTSTMNNDVSLSRYISIYRDFENITDVASGAKTSENSVSTYTIHQSKGLEFPVVFLIDADNKFNHSDTLKIKVDSTEGFAMKHFDVLSRVYNEANLVYDAVGKLQKRNELEEKMRVFYVALTRAKDFLFVTATHTLNKDEKAGIFTAVDYEDANSFYSWLKSISINDPGFKERYFDEEDSKMSSTIDKRSDNSIDDIETIVSEENNNDVLERMKSYINKPYIYNASTTYGIMHSVTEINKHNNELNSILETIDNDNDGDIVFDSVFKADKDYAAIGTAYHRVLELIDYDCYTTGDVVDQMKKMVEQNKLTQKQYDVVKPDDILKCMQSSVIKLARCSKVLREKSFSLYVKANDYLDTDIEDKVMIVGTMDLFIEKSDNNPDNILVDFKYSNSSKDEIRKRYAKQMELYSIALEKCANIIVDKKLIYVITTGEIIEF